MSGFKSDKNKLLNNKIGKNYIRRRKVRYRIKDPKRFIAVFLVLFLCAVAAVLALKDSFHPVRAVVNAIIPTSTPMPTSTPIPTPTLVPPSPTPTLVPTPLPTPISATAIKTVRNVKDVLIVLDPGHGGRDPGTVSPYDNNVYEKDIVLDIAKRTGALLKKQGVKVLYTRQEDIHLDRIVIKDLKKRCMLANNNGATIFVSIHVNAHDDSSVNGTEIWYNGTRTYYNGAFTAKQYAEIMNEEVAKNAGTNSHGIYSTTRFAVLNYPKMPSVIIETAYITNKGDYEKLVSPEIKQKFAEGIYSGIMRVLEVLGARKENEKWIILTDK